MGFLFDFNTQHTLFSEGKYTHICIQTRIHTQNAYIYKSTEIYLYMKTYQETCTQTGEHVFEKAMHTYSITHAHTFKHVGMHSHAHIHAHTCMHTCMHSHKLSHLHTRTHISCTYTAQCAHKNMCRCAHTTHTK